FPRASVALLFAGILGGARLGDAAVFVAARIDGGIGDRADVGDRVERLGRGTRCGAHVTIAEQALGGIFGTPACGLGAGRELDLIEELPDALGQRLDLFALDPTGRLERGEVRRE